MMGLTQLERDLANIFNRHNVDSQLGIPDFRIAQCVMWFLVAIKSLPETRTPFLPEGEPKV